MGDRRRVQVEPPAVADADGIVFYCAACYRAFPAVPTGDPEILALALRERDEHQKECRGGPGRGSSSPV